MRFSSKLSPFFPSDPRGCSRDKALHFLFFWFILSGRRHQSSVLVWSRVGSMVLVPAKAFMLLYAVSGPSRSVVDENTRRELPASRAGS